MWQFSGAIAYVLPVSGIGVVLSALLAVLRTIRRGAKYPAALRTALADISLVLFGAVVLYLVAAPVPGVRQRADLVPGEEIVGALTSLPGSTEELWQVVGNVLLLLPLGFLAPLRIPRLRSVVGVLWISLLVSSGIELAQYLFLIGRVASADDVILNTSGAMAGALLSRYWWASAPKHRRDPRHGTAPVPVVAWESRIKAAAANQFARMAIAEWAQSRELPTAAEGSWNHGVQRDAQQRYEYRWARHAEPHSTVHCGW